MPNGFDILFSIAQTNYGHRGNTLSDKELLSQFKAVEQMPEEEKSIVKKVVDALITKSKLKQLAV